jgi:hypothetical protein
MAGRAVLRRHSDRRICQRPISRDDRCIQRCGGALKPSGAPGGEAGTVAPFTFRRWNVPASTDPLPFAALTHLFWWDNRAAVADIVDIRLNGSPRSDQCQFLEGDGGATVEIGYRAYHPHLARHRSCTITVWLSRAV